jgi:hypothetical protein
MSRASKQPEWIDMSDSRQGSEDELTVCAVMPADFISYREDIVSRSGHAAAQIRFAVMQVAWRVGMSYNLPALMALAFRVARLSMDAITSRLFNPPVRRGRSGKRDPILSTQ